MKKFIFNKFAGLQAYRLIGLQAYMNSVTVIFQQRLSPLNLPHVLIQVPTMFATLVGNPGISAHWGDVKFCWEGNFHVVVGIWGEAILAIQTFVKAKKQHIVKIPPVGVKLKFCREENFFLLGVRNLRSGVR